MECKTQAQPSYGEGPTFAARATFYRYPNPILIPKSTRPLPGPTPSLSSSVRDEFDREVNMSAAELARWLQTDESKSVGQDSGDGSRIGHHWGERIVQILHKKVAALTADEEQPMHHVHSSISRHSAQRPQGDSQHSRWRYSLMNWGHDSLKK